MSAAAITDTERPRQRIGTLTPLATVLDSLMLGVEPVDPQTVPIADALGRTLAADVAIERALPIVPIALRDGFAVAADATLDASAYAPIPLASAHPVAAGEPMPDGTDAVLDGDSVAMLGGRTAATAVVAAGDGVLATGGDADAGTLRLAGAPLRRIDLAWMAVLGINSVSVRAPRVRVVAATTGPFVSAAVALIASAIAAEGGDVASSATTVDETLAAPDADLIIAIGGTGAGDNDSSVMTLARRGRVAFHGIGILPGETTALGYLGTIPVLLLPGRLDAALAGWLTLGRRVLARLAFRLIESQPFTAELARKVASPLGFAEVVPVRRRADKIEPLASSYLSPQALARSDGWILIPADSEGFAPGSRVAVRPWP